MLEKFFQDLAASNIRYCILHSWQSLPQSVPSDLDMVIDRSDLESVERILRLQTRARLVQLLHHEASCFYFVLALREEGRTRFALIDVATDFRRDGRIFFTAQELLADRRQWNGVWIASPRIEFRYLLIKKVLKGVTPEHQKRRIRELGEELGNEAAASARYLFGEKHGNFIATCISAGDWPAIEENLPHLRRAVLWQVVRRDPFNPFRYLTSEMRRVWNRCRFPTGLCVAVLGPDGAGKSTLIQALEANLTGAFRRTRSFHLRPMVIEGKGTNVPVTHPHGQPLLPWWRSVLKIPYYIFDYGFGYLSKVWPGLARSTLVLFDRYYEDMLIDPRRYRYGASMTLVRLARKFVPKPDLLLILSVDEEAVLVRKREVSDDELKRQCSAYRQLASRLPNAVLLNGSLSRDEVALEATDAILEYLQQRYLQRRHAWFQDRRSESLNWLESILFANSSRVTAASSTTEGANDKWPTASTFRWLSLNGGREYLIPTQSRQTSLKALQLYNAQTLRARFAKKLLDMGFKIGVASPLLAKAQIQGGGYIAQKDRTKNSLFKHLKEVVQRDDVTFAVSLGTPGEHRKPVIQLLTREGHILGYAKIGWNRATNALVQNEASVSRYLSDLALKSFCVPSVLYEGWWNDHYLCIQSSPAAQLETAPQHLAGLYLEVFDELKKLHARWLPVTESAFWKRLVYRIETTPSPYHRRLLQQGLRRAEESLSSSVLPFHFCHGDLAPWNAQRLDSQLFLFDWEYAEPEGLPGWDLFHFIVQTSWLLEKKAPGDIHKIVMSNCNGNRSTRATFDLFSVTEDALKSLFVLYVLDRLSFYALDESGNFDKVRFFGTQAHLCLSP
jgi:thymidylate kinase